MSHVSAMHMPHYKDPSRGKKMKERTVICAVLMLKMFMYYLKKTSKYRGKSL